MITNIKKKIVFGHTYNENPHKKAAFYVDKKLATGYSHPTPLGRCESATNYFYLKI
jgi:hypothetical protein